MISSPFLSLVQKNSFKETILDACVMAAFSFFTVYRVNSCTCKKAYTAACFQGKAVLVVS